MDLKHLTLFKALQHKMGWLSRRQAVLSQNVANSNTPDFRPQDLKSVRFSQVLNRAVGGSVKVARTHPNHQKPPSESAGGEEYTVRSSELKRNGDGVTVEQELLKMADVQMDYGLVTNLYRKHESMILTALGRNR